MTSIQLVCIAAAVGWHSISAAPLQPSDMELTAAYCIGVLRNKLAMLDEHPSPPEDAKEALRKDLMRLGHFIELRLSKLDTTILAIARRRANDDFMTWYADVDTCMRTCSEKHAPPYRRRSCWAECSEMGSAFERMRICSPLHWLPP